MAALSDTFTGSGDLAKLEKGGFLWQPKSGTWARSSGKAATSAAPSANPFAVVNALNPDVTINLDVYDGYAGGDAIYFRATDVNNWWRFRIRYYSSTVQTGTYNTGMYDVGAYVQIVDNQPTAGTQFAGYGAGAYYLQYVNQWPSNTSIDVDKISVNAAQHYSRWQRPYSAHYEPSYTTYYYFVFHLDKCVAGSVSSMQSSGSYSKFGAPRLRVKADGSTITCFWFSGASQQGSFSVTDSFNRMATQHGIGKGGSDSGAYASGIDNFSLDYNNSRLSIWDGATEQAAILTFFDGTSESPLNTFVQA